MLIAGVCFIVGALLVKETRQVDIADGSLAAHHTPAEAKPVTEPA
jgi:hypothetical protein